MDVLVHFAQDVVEPTRSDIAFHLLIPFVVLPAMEPGSKFGSLFKRKLFDGGLDLVEAHRLNNIQKRLSQQRANVTTHRTSENNHCSDVIAGFFNLI